MNGQQITISEAGAESFREISVFLQDVFIATYSGIISREQIEYMLPLFYTEKVFSEYASRNFTFLAARDGESGKLCGYTCIDLNVNNLVFIVQLYIGIGLQGQGIGRVFLDEINTRWPGFQQKLRVNRNNYKAINFYFKNGFIIEKIIDKDIGNGFYMNDFLMVKKNS